MFKTKIFENQWQYERNKKMAKYIHDLEMHDGCLKYFTSDNKNFSDNRNELFFGWRKRKTEKVKDYKRPGTRKNFQRKMKSLNIDLGTVDGTLSF